MKFGGVLFLLFFTSCLKAQIITTIAGTGVEGYSGDGGLAVDAQLGDMYYGYPATDKDGNVYLPQNISNTIRKIDVNGIITTIAGTPNVYGYTGDGGPAINALLLHPTAIAIDKNNNIIFSDANGAYLRKIDVNGIITTITGSQITNDCGNGDGGPLSKAHFNAISSITIDNAGNLYISDYGCNTLRKVNTTGIINTIAGNGTLGFSGDGGPAIAAQFAYPCKVAVDNSGNVFVADAQNHRIRKISTNGIITTVAGNGSPGYSGDGGLATNASLLFPGAVVIDNAGNLYTGDYSDVIRKIDPSGIITTYAGTGKRGYSGDGGPALLADIYMTEGRISIDNSNNIYFEDNQHAVVRKISNCLTATITNHSGNVLLCNSGDASFSIKSANADNYHWQVFQGNNWTNLKNDNHYSGITTNAVFIKAVGISMNKFKYRCAVTNSCGTTYSFPDTLIIQTPLTPSIKISSGYDSICVGTALTFTATTDNGGNAPVFQWQKNGINTGTNATFYTDNSLNNNDKISCALISNNGCLTTNSASSNVINVHVNPILNPEISINASNNNICAGITIHFSSSILNGGNQPVYEWFKNNIVTGINSAIYTDNDFKNEDVISCNLISNYTCPSAKTVSSNAIVMQVSDLATPVITINATPATVCPGDSVTFTASTESVGLTPTFQWYKNGVTTGKDSFAYTDTIYTTGDIINCKVSASGKCLTASTVISNSITTSVYTTPVVALDHNSFLCSDAFKILDAGVFSSYIWSDESTKRSLLVNGLGKYYVTVTDVNGCKGSDTTAITKLLDNPKNFLLSDTSICSYEELTLYATAGFKNYLWNDYSVSPIIHVKKPGLYWLKVTDYNNCTGSDTVNVVSKQCMNGFFIPSAFTPNNDGKNDIFKPLIFGNVKAYKFVIYNRWGETVFQSTELNSGWNGVINSIQQQQNTFVWICKYQIEGEKEEIKKGTVVLIR